MKTRSLLGLLAALALLLSCGPSFGLTDKEHRLYLENYPEYAEADRQLNEAWTKFKSVAPKDFFDEMLKRQREWNRGKDEIVAEAKKPGEAYAQTAARVMEWRTAYINSAVYGYDKAWVDYSIAHRPDRDEKGRPCVTFYIKPTRPALTNSMQACFYGTTRFGEKVFEAIAASFKEIVASYDRTIHYVSYNAGDEDYVRRWGLISEEPGFASEVECALTFENERLSCVSVFEYTLYRGWHENEEAYGMRRTALYDAVHDRVITMEDLFEQPSVALCIVKSVALSQFKSLNERSRKENKYSHDYDDANAEKYIDTINQARLNNMYIVGDKLAFDLRSLYCFKGSLFPGLPEDQLVIHVDLKDLKAAGLRTEYFGSR